MIYMPKSTNQCSLILHIHQRQIVIVAPIIKIVKLECECFVHAEEDFAVCHGNELAAVIVEPPIQGSAGMRIYPPLYLENCKLCDEYNGIINR